MFNNLPSQLFSPAKTFYIAYIVLNIFKNSPADWWQFTAISLLFVIVEIGHNDYLRIILNHAACGRCQCSVDLKKAEIELEKEKIKKIS